MDTFRRLLSAQLWPLVKNRFADNCRAGILRPDRFQAALTIATPGESPDIDFKGQDATIVVALPTPQYIY